MEGNDVLKNVKRGATADNTMYAVRYAHPNCPASLRNIAYTGTVSGHMTNWQEGSIIIKGKL